MRIYSKNINNGYMDVEFGNNSNKYLVNNVCTRSFHIGWDNLPKNTKSLVLVFEDFDAIPVCGFSWIHWVVANIKPEWNELLENASLDLKNIITQGKNSWSSKLINPLLNSTGFGGCAPPDKDHEYIVTLYALDIESIDLEDGFYLNELYHKIDKHIIESSSIKFIYKKII